MLTFADGLHCAFEHFHIQGETDRLDLTALAIAEQLTGATDFQVMGGQDEAGAKVLSVTDGLQALLRVVGHLFAWWSQQVGIGLVVAAANTTAQLVQLGQAELVSALNDDGVGARHVDPSFDDGRGDQHVEALVVEVAHHLFQLALAHLPVAVVLLHDEGANRQAPCRRRGDDRQVAHARHGHVQGARNRRGCEG